MSKLKVEQVDMSTPEAKKLLLQFVQSIQEKDNFIKDMKQQRKDVLEEAKSQGFDKTLINKTITAIRKALDTDDVKEMEQEMYYDIIKESNIVNSVKV